MFIWRKVIHLCQDSASVWLVLIQHYLTHFHGRYHHILDGILGISCCNTISHASRASRPHIPVHLSLFPATTTIGCHDLQ